MCSVTVYEISRLERHITEGSFFIADDRTIMQVQHGQGVPVTHGDRTLTADGTMMGQRLAALIEIRDQARRVVAPQLNVVTSTIARSDVAVPVKDARVASVVPSAAAAHEMPTVLGPSSNGR